MPKTPDYFAGKTIVITGAASGIGRATALIFAREGANVVCADINDKGASETAVEVDKKGSKAVAIKVDVTKRVEVKEMAERAIATFGRVEFLFNSAGAAMRRAKFLEIDDTLMEETFALNVNGILHGMQALLPLDLARTGQNAFSGRSAILTRADQASPQRRADAALWRTGGDRRIGSFRLFRRLRIYDRGHGLCERRRRMALIGARVARGAILEHRKVALWVCALRPKRAALCFFRIRHRCAGRNHVEQGGNKPLLDSPECATIGAKHVGARGCAL